MKDNLKKLIKRILKPSFLYFIIKPTKPLSDWHGFDRGTPLDRFYIENFLKEEKKHITGNCLEFLNNDYTLKFGLNVSSSDVIDIDPSNSNATVVSDVRNMVNIKDNTYDCIIMTQVLHFIDDIDSAIKEIYRVLKPSGVVLMTVPFINRIDKYSGPTLDYWRFTKISLEYKLSHVFEPEKTEIVSRGNVYSGIMSYAGACVEEVSKKKLLKNDDNFPLIVSVVARK